MKPVAGVLAKAGALVCSVGLLAFLVLHAQCNSTALEVKPAAAPPYEGAPAPDIAHAVDAAQAEPSTPAQASPSNTAPLPKRNLSPRNNSGERPFPASKADPGIGRRFAEEAAAEAERRLHPDLGPAKEAR